MHRARLVSLAFPWVAGDKRNTGKTVFKCILRLLDNAVKFSAGIPAPRVTVEAGPVASGLATIVVKDNGVGIDPAHHQRVFGLFEKLDPHAEGTGVGLAVVKRIVETHGGKATLESRGKDSGTEVRVSLPVPPGDGERRTETRLREAAGRPTG